MQKWSVSQSVSQKGRESVSQLHSHLGTYLGSQSLSQSFGYSIAQSVSQSVGQWVSKWANESISMSFWVSEWVSAQVSKFKAQFRCHASAMQNLFAIRCDYGPTLCKIQHLPKRPWCIFCKGELLLSWLPRNNATPLKYISIIYEFCLAWQGYDIWITFEPKSCSTAELVELNSLELS